MRRITLALVALIVALTACSAPETSATLANRTKSSGPGPGSGLAGAGNAVHLVEGALIRFNACDDFLEHVKAEAIERVGPYGLDWFGGWYDGRWGVPVAEVVMEAGEDVAVTWAPATTLADGGARALAGSAQDFSTTNNQEAGVDEADIVKTDGERILAITNGRLSVIDVTGRKPRLVGSLDVSSHQAISDMFLYGDTAFLIGNSWGPQPIDFVGLDRADMIAPDGYYGGSPVVTITAVDIAAEPEVVSNLQLDGSYVSSRLIDGIARIALTSGPTGFVWAYPEGSGLRAEREAIEANKEIIEDSTIENWVPYFVLSDADGEVLDEGPAINCARAHHPPEFGGFNMLSILSFDLIAGLDIIDSTGVLATGETLYSSPQAMYVATNGWHDIQVLETGGADIAAEFAGARTQIHQFDIAGATTEYVATGSVPGFLLNQFAMSEHDGDLRVASTTAPDWWGRDNGPQESMVSVLRPDDGELELIGRVDGLGKNEQIYSVRFLGDVAYVVTFRQIDPLFTIDLSDPTEPVVRGELKIPGYSAYLHPVSADLVLGVGQDANRQGRLKGSQVSLFDVSDLDDPERVAKLGLGRDSNSTAEYDHRAFLMWDDLVVLPLTEYGWREGKDEFHTGAVVIEVGDDSLTEIARVTHPGGDGWEMGWNATILRSLVIGDSLYTVSNAGLLESDLVDFAELSWLAF